MSTLTIGDYSIATVVEQDGPMFEAKGLLPDWTPDVLEEHKDWLIPATLTR